MILPDVNVLVHAFRSDASDHKTCRTWLRGVINGEAHYGMSPHVLSRVMRITTNRKVFAEPSNINEVIRFCDVLLVQPHCMIIRPGERHWQIFKRLLVKTDARGNMTVNAWFAALAVESGCEWITLDRNYAGFPDLRWRLPA